jgi:hypothetical protein
MLLLESDKRGSEFAMPLTLPPHDVFFLPENLYIIGLMNTADRSLAMVEITPCGDALSLSNCDPNLKAQNSGRTSSNTAFPTN